MKKIFAPLLLVTLIMASCAILKKKEKLGCPGDATGKSQDEIRDASTKKKYKGGSKF